MKFSRTFIKVRYPPCRIINLRVRVSLPVVPVAMESGRHTHAPTSNSWNSLIKWSRRKFTVHQRKFQLKYFHLHRTGPGRQDCILKCYSWSGAQEPKKSRQQNTIQVWRMSLFNSVTKGFVCHCGKCAQPCGRAGAQFITINISTKHPSSLKRCSAAYIDIDIHEMTYIRRKHKTQFHNWNANVFGAKTVLAVSSKCSPLFPILPAWAVH